LAHYGEGDERDIAGARNIRTQFLGLLNAILRQLEEMEQLPVPVTTSSLLQWIEQAKRQIYELIHMCDIAEVDLARTVEAAQIRARLHDSHAE
jgi:hypothetical protein